jgi:Flp pilus assembly pilin Flp
MRDIVLNFRRDEGGQDIVEYSLLLVLVILAALTVVQQTGASAAPVWVAENVTLQNAATQVS